MKKIIILSFLFGLFSTSCASEFSVLKTKMLKYHKGVSSILKEEIKDRIKEQSGLDVVLEKMDLKAIPAENPNLMYSSDLHRVFVTALLSSEISSEEGRLKVSIFYVNIWTFRNGSWKAGFNEKISVIGVTVLNKKGKNELSTEK